MANNLTKKILIAHHVAGELRPSAELAIKIDQTLTQDATGTMAYLQFEAMDIPRVRTELSVSYVDHNTLQTGFENADDHRFLRTIAQKYGIIFSRPGNGICHQVHLERFGRPGKTLLGSDSHTPTAGGLGMMAIGAGGLDVAVAMGGGAFYLAMPQVLNIRLQGRLNPWVTAKDVILEILRRLTVRGGVGKVLEYSGVGITTLSVPERATITNMGAELGATTSIFPSDQVTRDFLRAQGREEDWVELAADPGCEYDEVLQVDLSELEPMVACPHSPDNVVPVKDLISLKVDQVAIGSCTNSSYTDLMAVATLLRGRQVHPDVDLVIAPGSRQVLECLAANGALADLIAAGARILETACGPCIGMGQAPASGTTSLRTFNRNFEGRSGTANAKIYLASPLVAAASALTGFLTDPRGLSGSDKTPTLSFPQRFPASDNLFLPPSSQPECVQVEHGPNIKPLPQGRPLPPALKGKVLLKVRDNVTTDHIMPAGAKILPLRSNIPAMAEHVFEHLDSTFPARARKEGGGFVAGGLNYGQGSSREHAVLAPMYLGVRAVLALSFARIHRANLVNFGILPLTFVSPEDYATLEQGDEITIETTAEALRSSSVLQARNQDKGHELSLRHSLSPREIDVVLAGGLLNYTKNQGKIEN